MNVDISKNVELEAQVVNASPEGCYNPVVHFVHVSAGTFICGECEKEEGREPEHLSIRLVLRLTELGGKHLVLHLTDEHALTFAHEVAGLLDHDAKLVARAGLIPGPWTDDNHTSQDGEAP